MPKNNNDDHIGNSGGKAAGGSLRKQQPSPAMLLPVLRIRLASSPDDAGLLLALARACSQVGQWEEGAEYARRAWRIRSTAEAVDLLMDNLYRLGDREEFERNIPLALAHGGAHAQNMVSLHVVKDGQFARGFALRHALRTTHYAGGSHPVTDDPAIPWWDGEPFDGRLLVVAEQALGEELLNSGVFGDLVRMGQRATIECDPRLAPLFARSFPALDFVSRFGTGLTAAVGAGCRKSSASDLRHALHKGDRFSHPPSWLVPDPARRSELRRRYHGRWPGRSLAGISWRSFRAAWGSELKTLQLDDLPRTLAVPGTAFVSLQYGEIRQDLDRATAAGLPAPAVDALVDPMTDIDTLAAQVAAMDVVVSTSNTTAHLAGALGVPTLLMLPTPRAVFPYWGYRGEHTPWYPSITIVRGDGSVDRAAFDARVAATLAAMLAATTQEQKDAP